MGKNIKNEAKKFNTMQNDTQKQHIILFERI